LNALNVRNQAPLILLFATGLLIFTELGCPSLRAAGVPADVLSLMKAAERQFESGNYASAIATLQSAITQNPLNGEAYYWLGRCYLEIRDFDTAIANAEKSVALDAKNSLYHDWLGRAYGEKADNEKSFLVARKVKKEFQEAVRLNPSNIAARADLEDFCMAAPWIVGGSKDEAKDQADAIAAIDPIAGHVAHAKFYQEAMKKPDLAENEYRLILAAKPNKVEPYLEVAGFFESQNKPADLQSTIEAAAEVNAKDPRLTFFSGVALVLSGTDLARAEEDFKAYLASTPDRSDWPSHAAAREWLGRLYEAQGKPAEAAEQYRAALQLDPGRSQARSRLHKLEKSS
jgi:tetratricopeptide (TPR) repeat protein